VRLVVEAADDGQARVERVEQAASHAG
jgi:hypothetical protein